MQQVRAGGGGRASLHTCATDTGGTAYCWGDNNEGQLGVLEAPQTCNFAGRFSFNCSPAPVAVSGELQFGGVVTGLQTTCGFTTAGDLYCWGWNNVGQLGNGTTTRSSTPTKVTTSTPTTTTSANHVPSFSVSSGDGKQGSPIVPIIP